MHGSGPERVPTGIMKRTYKVILEGQKCRRQVVAVLFELLKSTWSKCKPEHLQIFLEHRYLVCILRVAVCRCVL